MAYRSKTYIDFDYYDAHDLNNSWDSSLTESIKNQLRVRFDNSKLFMILVGEKTKWNRKFIPWEIEQALKRNLPIIVANLNGLRRIDNDRCPTALREKLALHVAYKAKIIQLASNSWPASHEKYKAQGKSGSFYYEDSVYEKQGL
jgi:hypothetical protein